MPSLFKRTGKLYRTESRAITFIQCHMEDGDFILDPEYQRGYVWKEAEQQAFLENLFNGMPIGSLALIEYDTLRASGAFIEVVDGKQRITTINLFLTNQIPYIKNGKKFYFKDIPVKEQKMFKKEITIGVNVLQKDITELEKYQYFHAVNFAGIQISNEHRAFIEDKIKELEAA